MGKINSKLNIKPRDELKTKDWKFVEQICPDKTKHLDKWITKYDCDGKLKKESLIKLCDNINTKRKNKDKLKEKNAGYNDLDSGSVWQNGERKVCRN